jgi:hypothetical protein
MIGVPCSESMDDYATPYICAMGKRQKVLRNGGE